MYSHSKITKSINNADPSGPLGFALHAAGGGSQAQVLVVGTLTTLHKYVRSIWRSKHVTHHCNPPDHLIFFEALAIGCYCPHSTERATEAKRANKLIWPGSSEEHELGSQKNWI